MAKNSGRRYSDAMTAGPISETIVIGLRAFHKTQAEAERAARQMLANSGGGELTTMGRDGKIRSKDTIPPGNDPNPPQDREH